MRLTLWCAVILFLDIVRFAAQAPSVVKGKEILVFLLMVSLIMCVVQDAKEIFKK